jgi:hypothetical protein
MSASRLFHALFTIAFLLVIVFGGMSLFLPTKALGQQSGNTPFRFDIPAEPLDIALDAYTAVTRKQVLVDGGLLGEQQSTALIGVFSAGDALRTLLTGTGLGIRYEDAGSFALAPVAASGTRGNAGTSDPLEGEDSADQSYIAALQTALEASLCARPETRPGSYDIGLQLWIGPSGALTKFGLLGSTGNRNRDKAIAGMLRDFTAGGPLPTGISQPLTLMIVAQPSHMPASCPDEPNSP